MKLAVLGAGTIGSAVGAALLESGYEVAVYNRTPGRTEELARKGAVVRDTPAQAIKEADGVLLTVMDGNAVRQLLFSEECKSILAGKKIVNIATTGSEEIREIEREVAKLGGSLSELAIRSDAVDVREKKSYGLLAGSPELKDFWEKIFSSIGQVAYVGDIGAASEVVTLGIMGAAFSSLYLVYSAAFALKKNLPREVIERDLSPMVPNAGNVLPMLYERDYSKGFATLDGYRDTIKIGMDSLKKAGLPTQIFEDIISLYDCASKKGFGKKGESSLMEALLEP